MRSGSVSLVQESGCSKTQPKDSSSSITIYSGAISYIPPAPLEQHVTAALAGSHPVAPTRALHSHHHEAGAGNTSKTTTALLLLLYRQGFHSLHSSATELAQLNVREVMSFRRTLARGSAVQCYPPLTCVTQALVLCRLPELESNPGGQSHSGSRPDLKPPPLFAAV